MPATAPKYYRIALRALHTRLVRLASQIGTKGLPEEDVDECAGDLRQALRFLQRVLTRIERLEKA